MTNERFRYLLQEVLAAAKERRLPWEEGTAAESFRLPLRAGILVVRTWHDEDRDQWYGVDLENLDGRTIEDLQAYKGDDYALMEELFLVARSAAFNVDGTIDGILNELGRSPAPQGPQKDDEVPF